MRNIIFLFLLIPSFCFSQLAVTHGIIQSQVSAGGCDADAIKYYTAAGITDAGQRTAICDFVTREKSAGRWGTELQAFYILGNGSFDACKYNLIDTLLYKLTTSGTITYTTGSGGGADPTSGAYLTTNYTPSTHAVSVNSSHLMFWSQENVNESSTDMGILSATYNNINLFGNVFYARSNVAASGSFISAAVANTVGCFLNNRTSSTAVAIYEDGSSIASGSIAVDGLPTASILIFTAHSSLFSTKKCVFASIGAAISNPADYYSSINQLKTDLGL